MEKGSLRMQFLAAGSVTMVYFICGTFAGWPSPTIDRLMRGADEPHLTPEEASWVVSIIHIMQVVSCVPAGYLANVIGRKTILLISTLPFLLSWILVIFAESAGVLYAARIVAGLGLGLSNTVTPMYLGEIAEDRVRGALTTAFMVMMNLGLLFEQCVGPYVSKVLLGILSAIFPVIFAVTFVWMPESPYYYILRNRKGDAAKSLMRLRCVQRPESIEEELRKMELFVEETRQNESGVKDLITHRGNRKALFIVVSLLIFQNLCGIIAIVSYSTVIFKESGIKLDPNYTVMIMSSVQVILSIVSSSTVDVVGRRPMLLVSTVACAFSLAIEGLFFYLKEKTDTDMSGTDWVPISAMVLYLTTFTLGIGPIPNAIMSEIFPTNVKGIALSLGTILVGVGASIVSRLYEVISDSWGIFVMFWIYAVCTIISTVFTAIWVPETKGKSLMEIHHELSGSKTTDTFETSQQITSNIDKA